MSSGLGLCPFDGARASVVLLALSSSAFDFLNDLMQLQRINYPGLKMT